MKKKAKLATLVAGICAIVPVATGCSGGCTGCGNHYAIDANYTLNYIVVEENGTHVLHTVKAWGDSESDSVVVTTECCGNYIWSSSNKSIMYQNMPNEGTYDTTCPHLHLDK